MALQSPDSSGQHRPPVCGPTAVPCPHEYEQKHEESEGTDHVVCYDPLLTQSPAAERAEKNRSLQGTPEKLHPRHCSFPPPFSQHLWHTTRLEHVHGDLRHCWLLVMLCARPADAQHLSAPWATFLLHERSQSSSANLSWSLRLATTRWALILRSSHLARRSWPRPQKGCCADRCGQPGFDRQWHISRVSSTASPSRHLSLARSFRAELLVACSHRP